MTDFYSGVFTAGAGADVLERVDQGDRHDAFALGEAGELPRHQVRIEGQCVEVGFGLKPAASCQGPYGLAAFAQRTGARCTPGPSGTG
ncbi:hypothetical protein [Streptomyces cucumeris]|uniref:hypothetical protein n=1 Tax=Streptomyces cucumeris TaxID=2962890 RepID=UPI003EC0290C